MRMSSTPGRRGVALMRSINYIEYDRPARRGNRNRNRVGAEHRPYAAGRGHQRRAGRSVYRYEAVFGDHLNIVGATPAHPSVGHRNERYPVGRSFLDRRLRRVKERKHADIVAAIKSKRNFGLSQHLHGSTRQPEVFALEHVEDLGQARILIAAHSGIYHVVANDVRLIVMISDAA
jgi:hypothetical protein